MLGKLKNVNLKINNEIAKAIIFLKVGILEITLYLGIKYYWMGTFNNASKRKKQSQSLNTKFLNELACYENRMRHYTFWYIKKISIF